MRKACAILVASIATLAVLTTPVLARTANVTTNIAADATAEAPKADEQSAPPCHSYVQTSDGEWKPIPCEEVGAEARTPKKRAGGNADAASH